MPNLVFLKILDIWYAAFPKKESSIPYAIARRRRGDMEENAFKPFVPP